MVAQSRMIHFKLAGTAKPRQPNQRKEKEEMRARGFISIPSK